MKGIFSYHAGNTFLHKLNPLTKLALAFALCAAAFISEKPVFVLCLIAFDLAIARFSGIFRPALGLTLALARMSAVLFIVQLFFTGTGNVLFKLPVVNVAITDEGLLFSTLLALRLIAAALPMGLALAVTQPRDISNALVEKLGVPYKYAFALTTAIRFVPVLAEEMNVIIQAQRSRGVELDTSNIFKKLRLVIPLCAPLLISSVRKIDAAALSAELRGFSLRTRKSGVRSYPFRALDGVCAAFCAAICAAGALI